MLGNTAIKRAHEHLLVLSKAVSDRFLDEARIAAHVHHLNVIGVHQAGSDGDGYYLVLDYVEGESLRNIETTARHSDGSMRDVLVAASPLKDEAGRVYGTVGIVQNITELNTRTRRKGFGTEVRRRVMLGTYALSTGYYDAYYLQAQKVRTLIKRDFDTAFEKCDAIISATSPTVAFPIGSKTQDPLSMYLCDVLTLGGNLAGLPGISVPCGFSNELPVGLQILAPQWREDTALRVARAYEVASGVKTEVAPIA